MSNLPPPPPPPPGGRGQQQGPQRPEQNGKKPAGLGLAAVDDPVLLARRRAVRRRAACVALERQRRQDHLLPVHRPGQRRRRRERLDRQGHRQRSTAPSNDGGEFTATGAGERGVSEPDEALLNEKNVDIKFNQPQSNWLLNWAGLLLPIVLIIGFFVWMQRRAAGQMGNVMSIGRSRAKAYQAAIRQHS